MISQKNKLNYEEIELIQFLDELEQNEKVKKVKKVKYSNPEEILDDLTNINHCDNEYSVHDLCYGIEIKDDVEMLPDDTNIKFVEIPIYHPPTKPFSSHPSRASYACGYIPNCKKLKSNKIYTRFC